MSATVYKWIVIYDDGTTEEHLGESPSDFAEYLEKVPVAIVRNGCEGRWKQMIDQEKIIKALDCCLDIVRSGRWASSCIACPYAVEENSCREKMILDVIAMLKEQGDEITALSIALAMYEKQDIVRCKDCKHYKPYTGRVSGNLLHECEIFDMDIDEPDWFCANGERAVDVND